MGANRIGMTQSFRDGTMSGGKLRVLDLFSGIGAYSLGLQRTGRFRTEAFCEIEEYPRRILRKHWPHAHIYSDVRELTGDLLRADGVVPDWIVAGWPCQGNSPAGTGLGMDDPRSGLWSEIRRLAGETRPRGLLLENSSNLLNINGGRDFGRVLGDLAALGFDAEWHCLPAAAFDAPHIRDRVWIIASRRDAHNQEQHAGAVDDEASGLSQHGRAGDLAGATRHGEPGESAPARTKRQRIGASGPRGRATALPDPARVGCVARRPEPAGKQGGPLADGHGAPTDAHSIAPIGTAIARQERHAWEPEPDVVRVVHGAPNRVERIHALGNLNPPIIPETIARAILAAEAERAAA